MRRDLPAGLDPTGIGFWVVVAPAKTDRCELPLTVLLGPFTATPALALFAFSPQDVPYQLLLFALLLVAIYGAAKLVDLCGLGYRRSSRWRFLGSESRGSRRPAGTASRREREEDPFRVLEIAPTENLNDINAAYIRLARRTHPDLNPDDAQAKAKFQRVQFAFSRIGDEAALRRHLMEYPLDVSVDPVGADPGATIVELDLFQQDLIAYRAAWRLKQARAERDRKYLQGPVSPAWRFVRRTRQWLGRCFAPSPPDKLTVQRVCFVSEEDDQSPPVPYLQVFDILLRVGTQQEMHAVVAFLLKYNKVYFVDRFHTGQTVSFHDVGRKPGQNAALNPAGTYADFVTNLAKLGLYEGPDVRQVA